MATDKDGNQSYFLQDGLGSTTNMTDGSGNVTETYGYDVFGGLRSGTPDATEWLFTGQQRDFNLRRYYLRARYYDPETGRFLGRDPVAAGHPYAYVGNNSVNLVDPSGLCVPGYNCPPGLGGGIVSPFLPIGKEGGNFRSAATATPGFMVCGPGGGGTCHLTNILPNGYVCTPAPPGQPVPCFRGSESGGGSILAPIGRPILNALTSECAQGIAKVGAGTAAAIGAATGVGALIEAEGVVIVSASSAAVSATGAYYAAGPQNVDKVVTFLPGGFVQVYENC